MGKKRKKSKARRKRRRKRERGEAAAPDGSREETEPVDESANTAVREGPSDEVTADAEVLDDESGVDAVVDLEDDLDDPESRAELIAAASESGPASEEPSTAEARTGSDADEDAPLIGPDALVALDELRQEGVATVPGELVLELGETSSPEERDRLLAAALAHVEMQDAIYRVPIESSTSRRWKGLLAATLFLTALFLGGFPPAFLVPDAASPLTTAERTRGIRAALLMQAEQIEAFRTREERLPRSLSEVETALPDIRFVRSSNRLYQLIAYTPEGRSVVYDSASPDPSFAAVAPPWLPRRGES